MKKIPIVYRYLGAALIFILFLTLILIFYSQSNPGLKKKDKTAITAASDHKISSGRPRPPKIKILSRKDFENNKTYAEPIKTLINEAPVIALGKVEGITSAWNSSRNQIYSTINIKIDRLIKGRPSKSNILIKQLGGQVGDIKLLVSHMPEFTTGQNSLLFLKSGETDANGNINNYSVAGAALGKFDLIRDLKTGKQVVINESLFALGGKEDDISSLDINNFLNIIKERLEE